MKGVKGPPIRPVVNGKAGPNAGLANLISRILRPLRKQVVRNTGNEVISTEELLRWIEEYNKERERKNRELEEEEIGGARAPRRYIARGCKQMQGEQIVVGSMDVKSLYPSCKAKQTGEHIIEFFKNTDLTFNGVHVNSIVKYLALTGFKGEGGLEDYIPKPKGTTTLNSWLKTEGPNQLRDPEKEICLA